MLTLKSLEVGRRDQFDPLWFFQKYFLERWWNPAFVTFDIIISHVFWWKFHWNYASLSENIFFFNINNNFIFNISYFYHFFGYFDI